MYYCALPRTKVRINAAKSKLQSTRAAIQRCWMTLTLLMRLQRTIPIIPNVGQVHGGTNRAPCLKTLGGRRVMLCTAVLLGPGWAPPTHFRHS